MSAQVKVECFTCHTVELRQPAELRLEVATDGMAQRSTAKWNCGECFAPNQRELTQKGMRALMLAGCRAQFVAAPLNERDAAEFRRILSRTDEVCRLITETEDRMVSGFVHTMERYGDHLIELFTRYTT